MPRIKPPVVMASLVVFEPQVKPQRVAKPKPKAKPKPELKSANVPSAEVKVKPKVQPSSALDDAVRQRERLAIGQLTLRKAVLVHNCQLFHPPVFGPDSDT